LRAGGRGALQRAFDAGLMPKAMKQEWGAADVQGNLHPQADVQNGMLTPCATGNDTQQMWDGAMHMQSDDPWSSMEGFAPQTAWNGVNYDVHAMAPCPYLEQGPLTSGQQPMSAMMQPVQMPQVSTPPAWEAVPTDIERCMAIVMPQSAQFPCDKDLMAAQLKAAADCQCYED